MSDAVSVDSLRPGDHACLTFTDTAERLDIVAAFVRDGLAAGQKVVCLTEALPEKELVEELGGRGLPVRDAVRSGQLTVAGSAAVFLPDGTFAGTRMVATLREEIEQAGRDRYEGFRITSDMCWALRPVSGIAELMEYESQVTRLLRGENATAVCQYDRQCFDTVTLAGVSSAHAATVAAVTYHDDALLRICRQHVPSGVRIAGELDYRANEPLTRALTEAIALDEHIDINLTELRFIDAATAGIILQAAIGMSEGQTMTVRCRRLILKVFTALGAQDVAGVTVVRAGGDVD